MSLVKFVKNFQEKYPKLSEIIRFAIFGGICTLIDMFVMGIVLYAFEPSLYPNFFNVVFGGGEPKTIATVIGTGAGFIISVICNYLFSTFIVFKEKGRSKSVNGVVLFVVFAAIGLFLNMGGMWLGYDILRINEWVTKIIMTLIVLIFNYVTRKFIIYKKLLNKQPLKAFEIKEEKTSEDKQFATNLNLIQNVENENH